MCNIYIYIYIYILSIHKYSPIRRAKRATIGGAGTDTGSSVLRCMPSLHNKISA